MPNPSAPSSQYDLLRVSSRRLVFCRWFQRWALVTGLLAGAGACSKSTPPRAETPEPSPSLPNPVESTSARLVDAPTSDTAPGVTAPGVTAPGVTAPGITAPGVAPSTVASANEPSAGLTSGSSDTRVRHESESLTPQLLDAQGTPLPQTEARPSLESKSFANRLELLVAAIVNDQPEGALAAFFPQVAYAQVKAIKDPNRDWERRLVAAFTRNIHEYHKQLGDDAQSVRFVRLEVPEAKVKWIKPGVEGNRLGYYRVTRSNLVVAKGNGQELPLELTSLISWRGEWYVVHLHGFE